MTITEDNYLDFGNLLVNELAGDVTLAIIIGLLVIAALGVRFRVPLEVTMLLGFIYSGLITSYYFNNFLWMVSLFILGVIIYGLMFKVIKR